MDQDRIKLVMEQVQSLAGIATAIRPDELAKIVAALERPSEVELVYMLLDPPELDTVRRKANRFRGVLRTAKAFVEAAHRYAEPSEDPESPKGEPPEGRGEAATEQLPLGISFTCACGNSFHVKWTAIMPRQFMCDHCRRTYWMRLADNGRTAFVSNDRPV